MWALHNIYINKNNYIDIATEVNILLPEVRWVRGAHSLLADLHCPAHQAKTITAQYWKL